MTELLIQLTDPTYCLAAALGWFLGSAARTANHLGRNHP